MTMSKNAEEKALEVYPVKELKDNFGTIDINRCMREACIQGYDIAMQDFLEKACEWLSKQPMSSPVFWTVEDFKNYMEETL